MCFALRARSFRHANYSRQKILPRDCLSGTNGGGSSRVDLWVSVRCKIKYLKHNANYGLGADSLFVLRSPFLKSHFMWTASIFITQSMIWATTH